MLILVRGLPGAGKSTWARMNYPGVLCLENDMMHMRDGEYKWAERRQSRAVEWCKRMADVALYEGMDVIICNTFSKRRFIQEYVALANYHKTECLVYKVVGDYGSVHNVPPEVMQHMRDGWEDWKGEIVV